MARKKSYDDLQDELDQANEYIDDLENQLDDIASIAAPEEEEGGDGEGE